MKRKFYSFLAHREHVFKYTFLKRHLAKEELVESVFSYLLNAKLFLSIVSCSLSLVIFLDRFLASRCCPFTGPSWQGLYWVYLFFVFLLLVYLWWSLTCRVSLVDLRSSVLGRAGLFDHPPALLLVVVFRLAVYFFLFILLPLIFYKSYLLVSLLAHHFSFLGCGWLWVDFLLTAGLIADRPPLILLESSLKKGYLVMLRSFSKVESKLVSIPTPLLPAIETGLTPQRKVSVSEKYFYTARLEEQGIPIKNWFSMKDLSKRGNFFLDSKSILFLKDIATDLGHASRKKLEQNILHRIVEFEKINNKKDAYLNSLSHEMDRSAIGIKNIASFYDRLRQNETIVLDSRLCEFCYDIMYSEKVMSKMMKSVFGNHPIILKQDTGDPAFVIVGIQTNSIEPLVLKYYDYQVATPFKKGELIFSDFAPQTKDLNKDDLVSSIKKKDEVYIDKMNTSVLIFFGKVKYQDLDRLIQINQYLERSIAFSTSPLSRHILNLQENSFYDKASTFLENPDIEEGDLLCNQSLAEGSLLQLLGITKKR